MPLLQKIEEDLKNAILKKDEVTTRTLRMVKSDIMYEKTKGTGDLPDEKVIEIIFRASKKRKEAIEEFTKAGRKELAEKEAQELAIIESYLPKQLSEAEVASAIDKKITEMGAVSQKDFGKIMGIIMKELKGQTDGTVVKSILTARLEKL